MRREFGAISLSIIVAIVIINSSISVVSFEYSKDIDNSIDKIKRIVDNEEDFDSKFRLLMKIGHFPSISACIIKNNTTAWYKGYGKAKLFPAKKPTLNTVYPVGSISKTVTATAIMRLWEKDLFDLDDDVNDYLDFNVRNPNYPDTPITFRMLLSHHSSLTGEKKYSYWYLTFLHFTRNKISPYPLIEEIIAPEGKFYKNDIWNKDLPGSKHSYSNFNYMLLEHLIEVLSNMSFCEYCKENIFYPLGMYNTSFSYDDLKDSELAGAYHNIGNIFFPIPYMDVGYALGGLKTSMNDFSKYILAYLNKGKWNDNRILNESTIDTILTVQFKNFSNHSVHCLGWRSFGKFNGDLTFGHTGHCPGGSGAFFVNFSKNYAEVFFINRYVDFTGPLALVSWFMIIHNLNEKCKEI